MMYLCRNIRYLQTESAIMKYPMGNQPKMRKRREFFSSNNRAYFSTVNYVDEKAIYNKSVQYACINGKEQEPMDVEVGKRDSYIV